MTERGALDLDGTGPEGFGYLALLRLLERRAGDRPRIGESRRIRDEYVRMGQDPFLAFPDNELSAAHRDASGRARVRAKFLGFFGPYGALPLNTTEEVLRWADMGDTAFVEFTDIFSTRFQQLFYRSWSNVHAITQFDHPTGDRFQGYIRALAGIGTPAYEGLDSIDEVTRLRLVPLAMGRVRSPVRLRQMLDQHLGVRVDIEEMVPTWLRFEPDSLSRLGEQGSTLGRDMHLGSSIRSIGEKICIHVRTSTFASYRRFLPGGPDFRHLRDITAWYLGKTFEVDVAVWLPRSEVAPARLGETAELGWMACVAPAAADDADPDELVQGTIYRLDFAGPADTAPQEAA